MGQSSSTEFSKNRNLRLTPGRYYQTQIESFDTKSVQRVEMMLEKTPVFGIKRKKKTSHMVSEVV